MVTILSDDHAILATLYSLDRKFSLRQKPGIACLSRVGLVDGAMVLISWKETMKGDKALLIKFVDTVTQSKILDTKNLFGRSIS